MRRREQVTLDLDGTTIVYTRGRAAIDAGDVARFLVATDDAAGVRSADLSGGR